MPQVRNCEEIAKLIHAHSQNQSPKNESARRQTKLEPYIRNNCSIHSDLSKTMIISQTNIGYMFTFADLIAYQTTLENGLGIVSISEYHISML
jgi:hypothetical protein